MRKSVQISLLVLSLAALLIIGGTMAWFTATAEPVTNEFTAGTVEISINDVYAVETNWNPGDTTTKEISIVNEGTKCAYVRVKLTPEWGNIVEDEFVVDSSLGTGNVTLNWNETDWMKQGDYYYYMSTLPANGETELLLNSVTLKGLETGNEYQGKVFRIVVKADAVQCTNDAYKDVWGMTNLPWENGDNGEDNGGAA
jgi:predicted ribosomally synthesized peptide with SipW-like signal peptide